MSNSNNADYSLGQPPYQATKAAAPGDPTTVTVEAPPIESTAALPTIVPAPPPYVSTYRPTFSTAAAAAAAAAAASKGALPIIRMAENVVPPSTVPMCRVIDGTDAAAAAAAVTSSSSMQSSFGKVPFSIIPVLNATPRAAYSSGFQQQQSQYYQHRSPKQHQQKNMALHPRMYPKKYTLIWDEFIVATKDSDSEVEQLCEHELRSRVTHGKSLKIKKIISRKRYKSIINARINSNKLMADVTTTTASVAATVTASPSLPSASGNVSAEEPVIVADNGGKSGSSGNGGNGNAHKRHVNEEEHIERSRRSGRKITKPKRYSEESENI